MKYESLIFDIDGTLWDSRAKVAEGYNIQLEREGLSHLFVTAEDLLPLFGKVMTDIADAILDLSQVESLMFHKGWEKDANGEPTIQTFYYLPIE